MMRPSALLILVSLLSPLAHAAEEQIATVLQNSPLLSEPFSDAELVTRIKAKQQVSVIQRKGGWYQVSSGANTGWLRMSRVRFGDGTQPRADGKGLAQTLRFLSTGRSGADGVTVATGIRGLDAADVSNARPDHAAVVSLNAYRVKPRQARKFAKGAQLKSQPLGYFESE